MVPDMFDFNFILFFVILIVGLTAVAAANVFVAYKVARRVGLGSYGGFWTGLISGPISTVALLLFIAPMSIYGLFLTFPASAALGWAIAKWARMDAKDDN